MDFDLAVRNVRRNGERTDVGVKDGRFSAIGALPEGWTAKETIDGADMAICPGFVNAHVHAAMTTMRGYADDLELFEWLSKHIWPLEERMTEEDVYRGARLACLEMIKSGTTCFNDMYWHFRGTARAVEEMGLRATLSSVFIDFGDEAKGKRWRETTQRLFEEYGRRAGRIAFALGPHAIYTVSESSLRWLREFADEHGLILHVHLSETEREVEECLERHGVRPVEWLERIGFLGSRIVAAHGIWLSDAEIDLLAQCDATVVHNPVSNMKLASGSMPYAKLRAAGVRVALGTDGCASNNNLSMIEEMKFAALHAKLIHADPTVLPAAEALGMATGAGAEALGLDVGEIAVGRPADFLLLNLSDHRLAPGYRLDADLVYSADRGCVDTVVCDGRVLMRGGYVEGEEEIVAEARRRRF